MLNFIINVISVSYYQVISSFDGKLKKTKKIKDGGQNSNVYKWLKVRDDFREPDL